MPKIGPAKKGTVIKSTRSPSGNFLLLLPLTPTLSSQGRGGFRMKNHSEHGPLSYPAFLADAFCIQAEIVGQRNKKMASSINGRAMGGLKKTSGLP